jgi:hypothetical protein
MAALKALVTRRPSPAIVVALIAAVIAMAGTGYAASRVPRGSVGAAQLAPDAVTSAKVKNRKLSARDFAAGTPGALTGPVGPSGSEGERGVGGAPGADNSTVGPSDAYASYHDAAVPVGTSATPIASLSVPAGSYFIRAKADASWTADSGLPSVTCTLAGGAGATDVAAASPSNIVPRQTITLQLPKTLTSAGAIGLTCQRTGTATAGLENVKISAVAVGEIVQSP